MSNYKLTRTFFLKIIKGVRGMDAHTKKNDK